MNSKITYRKVGDYYIPNLTLKKSPPIGRYGRMRRDYLREHNPIMWNHLILTDKLYDHCAEIEKTVKNRLDIIIPQLAESAGVTEELKEKNQMKWVAMMNNCQAQAEEIVFAKLLYV